MFCNGINNFDKYGSCKLALNSCAPSENLTTDVEDKGEPQFNIIHYKDGERPDDENATSEQD